MNVTVEIERRDNGPTEARVGLPVLQGRGARSPTCAPTSWCARCASTPAHRRARAHPPARGRRHLPRAVGRPRGSGTRSASWTSRRTLSASARPRPRRASRRASSRARRRSTARPPCWPSWTSTSSAGSMGSVVGEKLWRASELAAGEDLPLVAVCTSGGARMQEGILSLMQMAKTACAVDVINEATSPFVTILDRPVHRRRGGELRDAGGHLHRRAGGAAVLHGAARHRRDHARRAAGGVRQRRAQPAAGPPRRRGAAQGPAREGRQLPPSAGRR